jgi:aerobic-type carbon monoxide dehydrogenase small subunit (CoxS/CutS family)
MSKTAITINGKSHRIDVPPDTPLLWVLRDTLGLTGTKYSPGIHGYGSRQHRSDCATAVVPVRPNRNSTAIFFIVRLSGELGSGCIQHGVLES